MSESEKTPEEATDMLQTFVGKLVTGAEWMRHDAIVLECGPDALEISVGDDNGLLAIYRRREPS